MAASRFFHTDPSLLYAKTRMSSSRNANISLKSNSSFSTITSLSQKSLYSNGSFRDFRLLSRDRYHSTLIRSQNAIPVSRGVLRTTSSCDGFERAERFRSRDMRLKAYKEEDWAKMFKVEEYTAKEMKEYLNEDPLWLWVFKSWYSGIKGALQFLWEQPGQIKHIEWPSLEITVKMALLTLVVVMLLIVFLATVDSLFSYLLASSLRQVP